MLSGSAPPCAAKGLVTPWTKAMLCLSTVSVCAHVPGGAAAHPVLALDRVPSGGRNPSLAAVSEHDRALDGIADVVARAGLAVQEILDFVPAHPGAAAVLVRLDRLRSLLLLDDLALSGGRSVGLEDPEARTSQDGSAGDLEALVDRAVAGADDLLDGDAVQRVHRVHQERLEHRRQVVAARFQTGAQPEGLGVEDAALLRIARSSKGKVAGAGEPVGPVLRDEIHPAPSVPRLPDDAGALLRQIVFRRARRRPAQLLSAAGRRRIIQPAVDVAGALEKLVVESEIEGGQQVSPAHHQP